MRRFSGRIAHYEGFRWIYGQSGRLTAPCAGYVRGSATWSLGSFTGRESRAERNCLAKLISVITLTRAAGLLFIWGYSMRSGWSVDGGTYRYGSEGPSDVDEKMERSMVSCSCKPCLRILSVYTVYCVVGTIPQIS